mgnify:CR=1 FL=1
MFHLNYFESLMAICRIKAKAYLTKLNNIRINEKLKYLKRFRIRWKIVLIQLNGLEVVFAVRLLFCVF